MRRATQNDRQRERQATLTILRSLTDRELRDIGIERGEIGYAARQGRYSPRRAQDVRLDITRWS